MAKKKKNSNYVTEKTENAKLEREEAQKKKEHDKTVKTVVKLGGAFIVAVAVIIVFALALGLFDYYPTGTSDLLVEFESGETLHVELYGNDAPETVKHILELVEKGYFNGLSLHSIKDGLIYGGAVDADGGTKGIVGEFSSNGKTNNAPHRRGVISMAHADGKPDSAYGQFFIVTEDNFSLNGNYAAFARITDGMDVIDKLLAEADVDKSGNISASDRLIIKSISTHASHSH